MNAGAVSLSNTSSDIQSLVQTGKGFLKDDPQSGSILRILAENGFQEKIEQGIQKGHTYSILHAAPSSDFTLVDSWDEQNVDEDGMPITQQKKSYQFFQIKDATATTIATDTSNVPDTHPTEAASNPPKENVEAPAVQQEVPVSEIPGTKDITPASMELEKDTTSKPVISEKKPSENTWLRSKLGIPIVDENNTLTPEPTERSVPVDFSVKNPESATPEVLSVNPSESAPASEKTHPEILLASDVAPITPVMPVSPAPTLSSDSAIKELLVQKKENSSYELLKKKFGNGTKNMPVRAMEEAPKSFVPPSVAATQMTRQEEKIESRKLQFLESAFGGKMEGALLQEWGKVKNIPARPFAYPTEYYWGSNALGAPIERSLENYPEASKKMRGAIVSILESLKSKNIDVEKLNMGQAVDAAVANDLV